MPFFHNLYFKWNSYVIFKTLITYYFYIQGVIFLKDNIFKKSLMEKRNFWV